MPPQHADIRTGRSGFFRWSSIFADGFYHAAIFLDYFFADVRPSTWSPKSVTSTRMSGINSIISSVWYFIHSTNGYNIYRSVVSVDIGAHTINTTCVWYTFVHSYMVGKSVPTRLSHKPCCHSPLPAASSAASSSSSTQGSNSSRTHISYDTLHARYCHFARNRWTHSQPTSHKKKKPIELFSNTRFYLINK